jgi:Cu/Ag efflux pump CusA
MNGLIAFALKQRVIMVVLFTATLIGGLSAFLQLNIEAYPDPTPPMVDVITQSAGLSAEEIERYITIPIETQTAGLPNLRTIRTISLYGLSDVKLQFSFDFTYEQALQQVLNRLSQLPSVAERRAAANIACQSNRRNLPLSSGWPAGLQRDRSEDLAGLDSAAAVSRRTGRN